MQLHRETLLIFFVQEQMDGVWWSLMEKGECYAAMFLIPDYDLKILITLAWKILFLSVYDEYVYSLMICLKKKSKPMFSKIWWSLRVEILSPYTQNFDLTSIFSSGSSWKPTVYGLPYTKNLGLQPQDLHTRIQVWSSRISLHKCKL